MLDEILVMNNRKVWTLVQKPNNNKIIGCRWVFTVKNDDQGKIVRYKARLVAQGFKQMKGIHYDEVFSPVVNFEIVRLCFSIFVCKLQWSHCQLDVKCAYLYAPLDENILMSQPQGFEDPNKPEYVCKLNKSIYGLHQSGRNWFLEIHNVLVNLKFRKIEWTNCIYTFNDSVVLLIYVDDIVVFAANESLIFSIVDKLRQHFDIKILGQTRKLLGVEFEQKAETLLIHQHDYINKICLAYKKYNYPTTSLPIAVGTVLSKQQCPKMDKEISIMSKFPYRILLGCLAFLAARTRPDICYAVNILSQFQSNPGIVHWNTLLKLLGYVSQTSNYKLNISNIKDINLECFSDADFAASRDDRISMGGLILFAGKSPIVWRTFKQKCVSLSTLEAEYVSLTEAAKELVWILRILKELRDLGILKLNFEGHLLCDNQAAINFSRSSIENHRTKHIDIKYHFVRNLILEKLFTLKYVNTKSNLADLFTKPLPKAGLKSLIDKIFVF
ncbi:Retrovirus-related Pol polyprotein from transposon TNT 1-94 [Araneus ventricosus]|uniref:Retrovirus-related Pol polyprotein from transposon TNT 1-94 n=1 Tax=Araneus ventricosus TaxID=182803 RepID=A0A4Y2IN84_ARAVE|nr:Retrovirus-related Pol polyprotein from transposon TNT 1-94 [Araneus ventricosus]GBM79282.1 Retrovirus-related Pol polyprotein from transposon TNT 1-94 [Araneus ventricosus]